MAAGSSLVLEATGVKGKAHAACEGGAGIKSELGAAVDDTDACKNVHWLLVLRRPATALQGICCTLVTSGLSPHSKLARKQLLLNFMHT